jgi:hypothetical protein
LLKTGVPDRDDAVSRRTAMSLVLLVILLLLVVGALPTWGYHEYGYGPSGIGGVVLLVLVIMLLTGRL